MASAGTGKSLSAWMRLAIFVGMCLLHLALMLLFRHMPELNAPVQLPMDAATALAKGTPLFKAKGPPLTIVKIDDAILTQGGLKATTPRAALADIVKQVIDARPKYVVLDIDLSYNTPGEACGNLQLYKALESVTKGKSNGTTVFLYRRLDAERRRFLKPATVEPCDGEGEKHFEDLVTQDGPIQWFSSDFLEDDDGYSREFSAWTQARDPLDGRDHVVLSAAYWVRFLQDENKPSKAAVERYILASARERDHVPTSLKPPINPGSAAWLSGGIDNAKGVSRTMMAFENRPDNGPSAYQMCQTNSEGQTCRNRFNALVAASLSSPTTKENLEGGITLIGRTDADNTDVSRTALGEMPSIYLLANSINTVLAYDEPIQPRIGESVAVAALLFAIFLILAGVPSVGFELAAFQIASLATFMILISALFFLKGYWVDTGIAALMIGTVGAIYDTWNKLRRTWTLSVNTLRRFFPAQGK